MSDIIGAIFDQLKNFGQWLADFIGGILSNIANLVFNSIVNFFAGMFNALKWIIDSAFRWMLDVVNSLIITPAQGLITNAVAFMQKKLFGTVYIILLMKLYDIEIKSFVEKPNLKKVGMMLLKPFLLYFALSLMWNTVFPTLKTLGIQTEVAQTPVQIIPPGTPQDVTTRPPTEYIKPELKLEDKVDTPIKLAIVEAKVIDLNDEVASTPSIGVVESKPIETSDTIDFTTEISTAEQSISTATDIALAYASISVSSLASVVYSDVIDYGVSLTVTPYASTIITDNINSDASLEILSMALAQPTDSIDTIIKLDIPTTGSATPTDNVDATVSITLKETNASGLDPQNPTWAPPDGWTYVYEFHTSDDISKAFTSNTGVSVSNDALSIPPGTSATRSLSQTPWVKMAFSAYINVSSGNNIGDFITIQNIWGLNLGINDRIIVDNTNRRIGVNSTSKYVASPDDWVVFVITRNTGGGATLNIYDKNGNLIFTSTMENYLTNLPNKEYMYIRNYTITSGPSVVPALQNFRIDWIAFKY